MLKKLRARHDVLMIGFALMFVFGNATAGWEDDPTHPDNITIDNDADAVADAAASSASDSNAVAYVVEDDKRVSFVLGANGGSATNYYTGGCVVPKAGGFFKRGFNMLGLIRIDQAVEVGAQCEERETVQAAHDRAMDVERMEIERLRYELERRLTSLEVQRFEECESCEPGKAE